MTQKNLTVTLTADQELSPQNEPSERILEISITAPQLLQAAQRVPLNLALVLDRSGSMSGEKLEYVKQAAIHVIDLLHDGDRIALVDFDNDVRVLSPSTALTPAKRAELKRLVAAIDSGGSTNLSGGWLSGCEQVASSSDGGFIRVLLLTDGQANVGITDERELAHHARALAERGVSTSTFGVGIGFNHHLLEAMSNQGRGRYHYIETPAGIPGIFELEFNEFVAFSARDLEITLTYPPALRVESPGDWQSDCPEPGKLRLRVGGLASGSTREIYGNVQIPAGLTEQELPFQVRVMARGENDALLEASANLVIRLVSREEAAAAPKNTQVLERFARVELAQKASEALVFELEGRIKEARKHVDDSRNKNRQHINPDLDQYYGNLSDRIGKGMSERERKDFHAHAYAGKQLRLESRSFRLLPHVKGHLVVDVDGKFVLVDTGSSVSFGRPEHWSFMGMPVELKPDFMGVSLEYISQVLQSPVDILLGMDVLSRYSFQVDMKNHRFQVSSDWPQANGVSVPLTAIMHVPMAEVVLDGNLRRLFVDTGAKLVFLTKAATAGYEAVDKEMDFYPTMGEFETEVFLVPVEIGGKTLTLRTGVLPAQLEQMMSVTGCEGLLSTQIFDYFRVTFNPRGKEMILEPYHN